MGREVGLEFFINVQLVVVGSKDAVHLVGRLDV